MAIKFTEDTATDLRFPYGDYREVEGNFGPQFMYTVEGGTGHTDRLFATPDLHRALQRAGVGPGSEFRITATRENRRRLWLVTPAVTRPEPEEVTDITQDRTTWGQAAEPSPEQRIEIHRPQPANGNGYHHPAPDDGQPDAELPSFDGNGDGRPPLPRELDQMGQLMGLCLHASTRAWKRHPRPAERRRRPRGGHHPVPGVLPEGRDS